MPDPKDEPDPGIGEPHKPTEDELRGIFREDE
jgi:hypothetical protein